MNKRAILSVTDKSGLLEFAKGLQKLGFEIVSTGGTLSTLEAGGIKVTAISDVTGFPECLDGRVKTLHPAVHAGILAMRADSGHMQRIEELSISPIDVVAVNLYPFKATVEKPGVTFEEAVKNIDIGGPAMLRSAAKNYQDVYVVTDPSDYGSVLGALQSGQKDLDLARLLMYKVFQHTAVYDTMIANYLRLNLGIDYPDNITFAYERAQSLRYGENPHQSAVFYREVFRYPGALTDAEQLWGKELSYNNISDANGALDVIREFNVPAAAAVKHANPCGVAVGENVCEAFLKAYEADKVSIFGGIVAVNRTVEDDLARALSQIFLEIIIAPDFSASALELLKLKKNIRLLKLPTLGAPYRPQTVDMKKVLGGLLVQQIDDKNITTADVSAVTSAKPSKKQLDDMEFAMKVAKHAKSNAVVVAKDGVTLGIGAGQTSRISAAKHALEHAGENAKGAALASDAFFPFSDCAELAAEHGITSIIQPGGSVRDQDSIDACDRNGIAMVFTGMRHFKH